MPVQPSDSALMAARIPADFERIGVEIVAAQLRALFADAQGVCAPDRAFAGLRQSHRRWLDATLDLLERHRLIERDASARTLRFAPQPPVAELWQRWEQRESAPGVDDNHRAYLALIGTCLRHLSEILDGSVPATDVMFPGSSVHLVEGIYKHNLIADHFNIVLGQALHAELTAKAAEGELRLLEIGAGTGGTTAALLPMLQSFGDRLAEYRYTDLSRAFLMHAEEHYAPRLPALKTAIFDVCRPLAGQPIERARYDAVIATNVLHATPNMRETVRNAKAALKRGGVLLVNEISEWSWHTHFTFGLLEGWWLYEDAPLRLPGSPGLSPEGWARLLKAERFHDLRFPAQPWHGLGQQIISARSDGVVRQRIVAPAAQTPAPPARAAAAPATRSHAPRVDAPAQAHAAPVPHDHESALQAACTGLFLETVAAALRLDAREIDTQKALEHYGLDSILVVQLTTRFRTLFPNVRSTLFFEVKSVDGLVRHFLDQQRDAVQALLTERGLLHAPVQTPSAPADAEPPAAPAVRAPAASVVAPVTESVSGARFAPRRGARTPSAVSAQASAPVVQSPSAPAMPTASQPHAAEPPAAAESRFDVAVIGVAGRYPHSPDLDGFWDNLVNGRNCVSEIPAERWRWQDFYDAEKGKPGKSYTRWGGFLTDIDKFDPLFFRIAPREAKRIDPQERLFLETSYHAIEDSGYTPDTLSASRRVGVFVGAMNARYTVQPLYYSIANRVSFLFDFNGPSFAVDSACSSSLTAIHVAIDNLRSGMCEVAIAGGVSLIVDPQHMLELTAVGMLSEGAECRSFGRGADGFVDAEGVGAVVLKPLAAALRDGDNIQAVIRGSALNTGGRTHGYTVPSPAAQGAVVADALERAEVDPADVGYVEAHGTGTSLGDPIEISGLARAFGASRTARAQPCAIGSLKSNIGHCESAAGIAALTKVLLQLRHGQLVPSLHAAVVNDEIDFAATPFRLQRELAPWQRPRARDGVGEASRIAGISSFGAGGANAHLVVEEAPPVTAAFASAQTPHGDTLIVLSARNAAQLDEKIVRLHAFVERHGRDVALADLAYTLQVGREAMDERLALVVGSMDALRRQLADLAEGRVPHPAPARAGVRRQKEFLAACRADAGFAARIDAWLADRDLAALADHWAKGVDVDWSRLYGLQRPRRVSLPTYPFARERHWLEPQRTLGGGATRAAAHPLLQHDTSTLRHPAYSVELDGREAFLHTHADGRRHLPLLLCAEMARAAVATAWPEDAGAHALHLDALDFDPSVAIDGPCSLHIALLADGDDALRFEIYTRTDAGETVLCQGLGRLTPPDAAEMVDVAALRTQLAQGETLSLPAGSSEGAVQRIVRMGHTCVIECTPGQDGPWMLSPGLVAAVGQGLASLAGAVSPVSLFAAGPLRFPVASVGTNPDAASRPAFVVLAAEGGAGAATASWSLRACDAQGRVLVQANGLDIEESGEESGVAQAPTDIPSRPQPVAIAAHAASVTAARVSSPSAAASETPRLSARGTSLHVPRSPRAQLPLPGIGPVSSAETDGPFIGVPIAKPDAIRLAAVEPALPAADAGLARPVLRLPAPDAARSAAAQSHALVQARASDAEAQVALQLRDLGAGVYAFALAQARLTPSLVDDLLTVLAFVAGRDDARVLLLEGAEDGFLRGDAAAMRVATDAGLFHALGECPVVTIAAMRGGSDGAGFLLGALCDFAIVDASAPLAFGDRANGLLPTPEAAALLRTRFGAPQADDLLYVTGAQTADALARKGWTLPAVAATDVLPRALALAERLAAKPVESLRLLKRHMARELSALCAALGTGIDGTAAVNDTSAPAAADRPWPAPPKGIALEPSADGVLVLRLLDTADLPAAAQLTHLGAALAELRAFAESGQLAAVLLTSAHRGFLPGFGADSGVASGLDATEAAEQALHRVIETLAAFPAPVVVAFERDADAAGWLLGLSADACVYAAAGQCSVGALWNQPHSLRAFAVRLERGAGREAALRVLFGAPSMAASAFALWAGALAVDDPISAARALAATSPLRARGVLAQWRSGRPLRTVDEALPPRPDAAVPPPESPVVQIARRGNGVRVVRMVEREAKNMFSPALIEGIETAFAHLETDADCRAVVLSGFDTYFACGGTRESLLAIQQGKASFTDTRLYQLPMSCRVPVYAAMQGHGIGGGWSFGMFADVRLFSAESRYISPYMRYGFTPGAGSTLIFPTTLGLDLAREVLLTASEYTGRELGERGMHDACLPRADILDHALALADALADRPAAEVAVLKHHFSVPSLAAIEAVYSRELDMHARSFVGSGEVVDGVMRHFLDGETSSGMEAGGEAPSMQDGSAADAIAAAAAPSVPSPASTVDAAAEVEATLRGLLASELQLGEEEIDEDTPFIDLGLDSITGVTWVRKINAAYGTRIEATKVYSHPNLRQFRDFVVGQLPAADAGAARPAAKPVAAAAGSAVRASAVEAAPAAASMAASAPAASGADGDTEAALHAELRRLLAQELHLDEEEIDAHRQFVELGLDSITGVTWVRRINAAYGIRIEATKVYSHPTLDAFARFVATLMPARTANAAPAALPAPVSAPAPARKGVMRAPSARATRGLRSWRSSAPPRRVASTRNDEPIAVIGMAGQFPQAADLDAFWRNIAAGRVCIDTVPAQRFDIERYFSEDISIPDTTNSRWMGVLPDVDAFDPLFFNIAPTEAESMDPQQRLMLQNCWHAIENAAIDPRTLSGSLCGVFIGCGATDYHQRSREHRFSAQGFTGAAMSILAARIAYFLNLQGPCISIDTACSSSLVAIANACDSLVAGNCDMALAGGVAVMAGPMMHVKTGQAAMLSTDGRCFAFDHRANGFVPGEGVGAVLLKRLSNAQRDGDIVHAVIRGWGVNQDGKTNGITAPNPVSQTRLMRAVYDRFGIDPEDIQLVEAHGTGTKLGDPIEVEGLNSAFRHYTQKSGYCALGSVKSNVGHCLFAAGIAGVIKAVQALRHRQLPPAADFERLNPHIDLDGTPFTIDTRLRAWPENARGGRTAVVSSFGFSGTNAHLVLEGAPAGTGMRRHGQAPAGARPVLVPLSAKSPEQLRQRAQDLAAFLVRHDAADAPSLEDVAYTLQIGREAMEERCAFVVASLQDLRTRLAAFAAGERGKGLHVGNIHQRASRLAFLGQDRELRDVLIQTCLRDGKLDKLAELWVEGVDVDWSALHPATDGGAPAPQRIVLPLYPFAKERYWLEDDAGEVPADAALLHPLLHANVSTLRQQRYRTTLRGDEFFLRDHRVRMAEGRVERVLPGVAYLEMAAAAIRDAMPEQAEAERAGTERLVLSDIAWWRPVVVAETTTLELDLGFDDAGAVRFEIASVRGSGGQTERIVHCQGEAGFAPATPLRRVDPASLEQAGGEVWQAADVYAVFDRVGLQYGPAHRGLHAVARAGGRLVARVRRPAIADDPSGFGMHPSVMDAALQACIGFLHTLEDVPDAPSVPFALRALTVHAPCPAEALVVLTASSPAAQGRATASCDVAIHAPDGTLCIALEGFRWRAVNAQRPDAVSAPGRPDADAGVDGGSDHAVSDDGFDEALFLSLLDSISKQELSAEDAAELGLMS